MELSQLLEEGKLLVGARSVLKALKKGEVSKVIIAKNAPREIREDVKHYCELSNAELVEFEGSNKELGIACKKPFGISVLGILK